MEGTKRERKKPQPIDLQHELCHAEGRQRMNAQLLDRMEVLEEEELKIAILIHSKQLL